MSPYVLATINAKTRHLDIALRHRDQANILIGGFEVAVTAFLKSTPGVDYFLIFKLHVTT